MTDEQQQDDERVAGEQVNPFKTASAKDWQDWVIHMFGDYRAPHHAVNVDVRDMKFSTPTLAPTCHHLEVRLVLTAYPKPPAAPAQPEPREVEATLGPAVPTPVRDELEF